MKASLNPLLAILLAAPGITRAAVDFTLQHKVVDSDAIALQKTYVTDGASKIFLAIPTNWPVTDSAQSLDLSPDVGSSRVRFESYKGAPLTIDQTGGQTLAKIAAAQVPQEAKNVKAEPVVYNPFPILGWTDMEATLHYEAFGQTMRHTVMHINMLPGRVVEFSVTAPEVSFDKIYKQARAVLSSWFEPSRDLPPELARGYEEGKPPIK